MDNIDCTGVKLIFDGQMRRFPFQGKSFDSLREQVIALLGLENSADLVLKYTDEEGDHITISSDLELKSAVVPGQLLRLVVSIRTPDASATVTGVSVSGPMDVNMTVCDPKWGHPRRAQFSEEEWAMLKQHKKERKLFKHHDHPHGRGGHHPYHHGPGGHHHGPRGPHGFGGPGSPHHGFGGPDSPHHGPGGFHSHPPPGFAPPGPAPPGFGPPGFAPPPFALFGRGRHGGHGFHHPPHDGPYKHPHCDKGDRFVARYAQDVTIPDGSQIMPNTPFVKTWRLRNEGLTAWPVGSRLHFVGKHSDDLGGPEYVAVDAVNPGQDVDISVNLCAPSKPGRYTGYWRMCTPDEKKFGQRVWVSIVVPGATSSSEEDREADRIDALVDVVLANEQIRSFGVKRHRVFRLLQRYDGDTDKVIVLMNEKIAKKFLKGEEKQKKSGMKSSLRNFKSLRRNIESVRRSGLKNKACETENKW